MTVWGFELSQQQHLATDFNIRPADLGRFFFDQQQNWQQYISPEVFRRWLGFLLDYRVTPKLFDDGGSPQLGYNSQLAYLGAAWEGDKLKLDFSEVDRNIEFCLERGASLVNIGTLTHREVTGEYGRFWEQYLPQVHAHLIEKGWLERSYVYGWDEPEDPQVFPKVHRQMEMVKQLAPGVNRLIPMPTHAPRLPAGLYGDVDIWVPVNYYFEGEDLAEVARQRHSQGEQVWTYVTYNQSYPSLLDVEPFINHRILLWQIWKYGLDGLLYYGTVFWCQNSPHATLDDIDQDGTPKQSWQGAWGMGVLVYPGGKSIEDEPQPSLRLEIIRDGIEDWEYFYILREQVNTLRARGASTPLLEQAEELLHIPPGLVGSLTDFTDNPSTILAYRRQVAEIIQELQVWISS